MKLVFPDLSWKEKAVDYIREFYDYGSEINGSSGLDRYMKTSTYEEWLKKVRSDMDIANIGKSRVPALTYFYVREEDEAIVGIINIRLALNDHLRKEGGHVGYSVRPTERGKHYATQMLAAALGVFDTLGVREVIVSCDRDNPASAKVIKNCGGELDAEFYSDTYRAVIQRYVIRRG